MERVGVHCRTEKPVACSVCDPVGNKRRILKWCF